jgi:hypothetical protein
VLRRHPLSLEKQIEVDSYQRVSQRRREQVASDDGGGERGMGHPAMSRVPDATTTTTEATIRSDHERPDHRHHERAIGGPRLTSSWPVGWGVPALNDDAARPPVELLRPDGTFDSPRPLQVRAAEVRAL